MRRNLLNLYVLVSIIKNLRFTVIGLQFKFSKNFSLIKIRFIEYFILAVISKNLTQPGQGEGHVIIPVKVKVYQTLVGSNISHKI